MLFSSLAAGVQERSSLDRRMTRLKSLLDSVFASQGVGRVCWNSVRLLDCLQVDQESLGSYC